jgi:hypothetical protein
VKLSYLTRSEINNARWDKCIDTAVNGSVFAYSWYLDKVAPGWEALVDEQYHTVMPLTFAPYNRKKDICQPLFTPSLGIFSNHLIFPSALKQFYNEIESRFRSVNLVLSKMNTADCFPSEKILFKAVWEKDMIQTHSRLKAEYSYTALVDLAAFHSSKFKLAHNVPITDLQQFWAMNTDCSPVKYSENNVRTFRLLMNELNQRNLGSISVAYDANKQPCAMIAWAWSRQRISVIHQMANAKGLEAKALPVLIDNIMQKHSEKAITLSIPASHKNSAMELSSMGFTAYQYPNLHIENKNLFSRMLSRWR